MNDDKSSVPVQERRRFLCVLCAGVGVVTMGATGCAPGQPTMPFTAGAASDHPVGTFRSFRVNETIVARDSQGFYAFSTLCTHQQVSIDLDSASSCSAVSGCTQQNSIGTTLCSAHGSRFDSNGAPTHGPANTALPHFSVTIVAGVVHIDPGAVVTATDRMANVV